MADQTWEGELREALAQVESQRDDAVAYLSAIKLVLDALAKGHGPRDCAQRIAGAAVQALAVEACAVALAESGRTELTLAGFATQGERLGGPRAKRIDAGWLALAGLVRPAAGPSFFQRLADGSFEAVAASALAGEGFAVLPLVLGGEAAGALVLHSLTDPAQTFARGRALALLADIAGQVLTIANLRHGVEQICCELEGELGVTRRALSDQEETLRSQEANIRELTQALIRSNRVKRDFLGTVSHELRTPLNAILGYTSLMRDGMVGPVSDEQSSLLDRVMSNSHSLNTLIDDILFFVEIESDRIHVRRGWADVRELIAAVVAMLPQPAGHARVPLRLVVAPGAETLRVDTGLLRRVLFHLLGNAFKFTPAGEVTVVVGPDEPPGTAVIAVRDTGVGICAERVDEMFELFAQADGSATRRFPGMGMGLTLVQRCVRLLDGEVTVESAVERGSEFRVRIPGALLARPDTRSRPPVDTVH